MALRCVEHRQTSNPMRVADLGRIDRTRTLSFTFDGIRHSGFAGDTLAYPLRLRCRGRCEGLRLRLA
jgi:hypothetical protein